MTPIELTVNGKTVSASIEPRTHLADFIRDSLNLTGTHLGCEHGVCGACTLNIDGMPARSCITLAVACDGASITTVEGLDDDEIVRALRAAFSREHALQCGYCTPGMLVSARDIVMRMPDATEHDIRVAMSGNLCRCTGYVGIVRAIQSVVADHRSMGKELPPNPRTGLGPAGSGRARPVAATGSAAVQPTTGAITIAGRALPAAHGATGRSAASPAIVKPQTTLHQSFTVNYPRDRVWAFFARLDEVTTCLPGTSILGTPTDNHVSTRIRIKAGPIVAEFDGEADVARDPSNFSGIIHGSAQDARSRSTARGEIRYTLLEDANGAATQVRIEVGFTLAGPLAQFSRSDIVHDLARRMTEAFARNLRAGLDRGNDVARTGLALRAPVAELDAGGLFFSILGHRLRALLRRLLGR